MAPTHLYDLDEHRKSPPHFNKYSFKMKLLIILGLIGLCVAKNATTVRISGSIQDGILDDVYV